MTDNENKPNEKPLLIKRYASRRLYNTETSDYVTLQEIADLIRSGRDVQILDLNTGDDLTRQYLIQIIAEHEARGEKILPVDVLTEIVRSYSDRATAIPDFLRASFEVFQQNQEKMIEGIKQFGAPAVSVKELHEKQKEFFQQMTGGWALGMEQRPKQTPEKPNEKASNDEEIEAIKRQLAELQAKVANL